MRLYEITAPRILYLCTRTPQQLDSTVEMDEPCSGLGDDAEAAIEARRPAHRLSRSHSLMLSPHPVGAEYTYVAEPAGVLELLHAGWLKKFVEVDPSQPGVRAHYADGYWSGLECAEARGEPWEYRTSAAKLLKRIGSSNGRG